MLGLDRCAVRMGPLNFYTPHTAQALSILRQMRRFETISAVEQRQQQEKQLKNLLNHALKYSVFWQERLANLFKHKECIRDFNLLDLPILTRYDLQQSFHDIKSRWGSVGDNDIYTSISSGSTGVPVRVEKYKNIQEPIDRASALLDLQWHKRNPNGSIAFIGFGTKDQENKTWGGFYNELGYHGKYFTRPIVKYSTEEHLEWLSKIRPNYIKASPFLIEELANLAIDTNRNLRIEHIISMSERVTPKQRRLAESVFGAKIIDRYSCEETGMLALQCPHENHLHVLSANNLVEIVNSEGKPCETGEIGRVLVTNLYSYAMPIMRYELGDLAEWSDNCKCGIRLPILGKLWGRIRHRAIRLDGTEFPMGFLGDDLGKILKIKSFRTKQYENKDLELELVVDNALSDYDLKFINQIFMDNGFAGLNLGINQVDKITWPENLKRDEFMRVSGVGNFAERKILYRTVS